MFKHIAERLLGHTLAGKYAIESKIGEGGTGVVFKATDIILNRPVAIKIVHPEIFGTESFLDEARIIAKLEHPNVIAVYSFDHYQEDGINLVYLVTRYAGGGTLSTFIEKRPSLNQIQFIFTPICDAIQAAHNEGIVHLDLKPANILFDDKRRPLVSDFGIACLLEGRTRVKARTGVGTETYMAPEQFFGSDVGAYSDVFALGIILHEMIVGETPKWDMGSLSIQPSTALPDDLFEVICKAVEFAPEKRYQSAIDLAQAYSGVLDSKKHTHFPEGYWIEDIDSKSPETIYVENSIIEIVIPEQKELENKRLELARLEIQLAEQELQLATAHAELHLFSAEYKRLVGARYAELDDLEAQIAELLFSVTPSDAAAQENMVRTRTKAQQTAREMGAEDPDLRQEPPETQKKFAVGDDVKKLFREIAKQLHPDFAFNSDDLEVRTQLMAEANDAYKRGDTEALKLILETWKTSPEAVIGNSLAAQIERVIRRIHQIHIRMMAIKSERSQLEKTDMYRLKVQAEEKEKSGINLFIEMCAELDERIASSRGRLEEMKYRLTHSDEILGDEYWDEDDE